MNRLHKATLIQWICVITIVITTIYLAPRLQGIEKVAWGIWGFAIMIGSLVEAYKDQWILEQKNKRRENKPKIQNGNFN